MSDKVEYKLRSCLVRMIPVVLAAFVLLPACRKTVTPRPPSKVIVGSDTGDVGMPDARRAADDGKSGYPDTGADPDWLRPRTEDRIEERRGMVNYIRRVHDFDDESVLSAMLNVPRHWFVRPTEQRLAYADTPLPIGHRQTISQPFIVAYMTSLLKLDGDKRVLEIGTGSGYQAAVLAEFTPHVYTIEIVEELGRATIEKFKKRGYATIKAKIGDGYKGWVEHEPFDAIIVTCAPDDIPPALIEQLKPGGRMVIPVGSVYTGQQLVLVSKDQSGKTLTRSLLPVRFVPMVHEKK